MDKNVIKENAERYYNYFRMCKIKGYSLYFQSGLKDNKRVIITKSVYKDPEIGFQGNMYIVKNELSYFINNREIHPNEIYYQILECIDKEVVGITIIPNLEMVYLLSKVDGDILFSGVTKTKLQGFNLVIKDKDYIEDIKSNTIWYHGSSEKLKSVTQLDITFSSLYNDFGRGLYFSNSYNVSKSYLHSVNNKKRGNLLKLKWHSEELDILLKKVIDANRNNKGVQDTVKSNLIGKNGEIFRINIFLHKSKKWSDTIYEGWVMGNTVLKCDAVIAPISDFILADTALYYQERYKNNKFTKQEILNEKEKFYSTIFTLLDKSDRKNHNMADVFQMCVYNDNMLKSFIDIE